MRLWNSRIPPAGSGVRRVVCAPLQYPHRAVLHSAFSESSATFCFMSSVIPGCFVDESRERRGTLYRWAANPVTTGARGDSWA